jgi:sulfoxide reductase heme-binding subunit YedZ
VKSTQPTQVLWWLVSRASGIVAIVLISLSVVIGLAMAAKVLRRPGLKRAAIRLHEHMALVALAAILVHGLALLGDHWLKPGWQGISIPFALGYKPGFTGVGIIAGYLALLLGPSFYLRKRIGARRWRKVHRATVIVWVMSVVHALGAGSDGATVWLRAVVLLPLPVIAYLLVVRAFGTERRSAPPHARRAHPDPPRRDPHPARRDHHPARHDHHPARHDQRLDQLEVAPEIARS